MPRKKSICSCRNLQFLDHITQKAVESGILPDVINVWRVRVEFLGHEFSRQLGKGASGNVEFVESVVDLRQNFGCICEPTRKCYTASTPVVKRTSYLVKTEIRYRRACPGG